MSQEYILSLLVENLAVDALLKYIRETFIKSPLLLPLSALINEWITDWRKKIIMNDDNKER